MAHLLPTPQLSDCLFLVWTTRAFHEILAAISDVCVFGGWQSYRIISYPTLQKSLRTYGRQTIVKPIQDASPIFNKSNGNCEKVEWTVKDVCIPGVDDLVQRYFRSVDARNPTTGRSTNLNILGASSSDVDIPNEVFPVISLIPPTPRGSVGSPAHPPDSPITVQKFLAARSSVLLKRRSSFMHSAPPLMVAPCLVCSRPGRFLSEDDLSCRKCRKQWLACQLWYQACDGGRMERLRVPFVRPGESNAVNRALSESLGLLPSSASERDPPKRIVKPHRVLALCLSVLVKPFRNWVGRKGRSAGSSRRNR